MHLIPKLSGDPTRNWKVFTTLSGNMPLPNVTAPLTNAEYQRSVSTEAYAYPYHNYYTDWPQRCVQDPISAAVTCLDRNFVGPDYRNPFFTGSNYIDPVSKRCRKERDFTPVVEEPLEPFSETFPNSILGTSW